MLSPHLKISLIPCLLCFDICSKSIILTMTLAWQALWCLDHVMTVSAKSFACTIGSCPIDLIVLTQLPTKTRHFQLFWCFCTLQMWPFGAQVSPQKWFPWLNISKSCVTLCTSPAHLLSQGHIFLTRPCLVAQFGSSPMLPGWWSCSGLCFLLASRTRESGCPLSVYPFLATLTHPVPDSLITRECQGQGLMVTLSSDVCSWTWSLWVPS